MVQMKVNNKLIALHVKDLYIPHGSDESIGGKNESGHEANFISHMVQMKDVCVCVCCVLCVSLYPTWFR